MIDGKVFPVRSNERGRIPEPEPGGLATDDIVNAFAHRMMYSVAKDHYTASDYDLYNALALAVRDRLMERWFATQKRYYRTDAKRVYYLSLEFLLGRLLHTNILNLGANEEHTEAMERLGFDLRALREQEPDSALGNGGLGRLAACFLDSAATLALPFYGYGIRYEYGIFRQRILEGRQVEAPDNWLRYGNPWEIPRPDVIFPVHFFGKIHHYRDKKGGTRYGWIDTEEVWAMAYDIPVVGYRNDTVNSLRLWAAKSSREFDLDKFNAGEYVRAVEDKNDTENISKVLYPADDIYVGKELRLKQQYFFVSATLQDLIRRFKKRSGRSWSQFPEKVAIQLNDTHPAIAIPELMRVLMDEERLGWDLAWGITERTFGYTNHTVLPEALETWPIDLIGRVLPRHLQIIEEIDRRARARAQMSFPGNEDKIRKCAVIDDAGRSIRMANLAIVGSHSVNGVAKLHAHILETSVFPEYVAMFPGRFSAKTNGVTPRRWLLKCNPELSSLVTEVIGEAWITDLDELRRLEGSVEDASFRERWSDIKRKNKVSLSNWVQRMHGIRFDPDTMLDCQVKRIHEYKRQALNVLHVIDLYHRIKDGEKDIVPRTVLFGGKAAPSYKVAKHIIKLINAVGELIAWDPEVCDYLKVVFVPDYRVTTAEKIFPACDLSEQISQAGMEASGTGNMKASLNGALTIGTLDGANIEIRDEVGEENMFIFGHDAEGISSLRTVGYSPTDWIAKDARLTRVIDTISGLESQLDSGELSSILDVLSVRDRFFHCADFTSYLEAQRRAENNYRDQNDWVRKSILNVARMGRFSSDRTVREYATEIWDVEPVPITLRSPAEADASDEEE